MTETADIIVIGGGMAGIGAAARLAGSAKVVVLERESQPGYHSTGRSAAMFIENYGGPAIRKLTRASRAPLENPDTDHWHSAVLGPRGVMYLAMPGQEATLRGLIDGSDGVDEITPDDACSRVPLLKRDSIVMAAFEQDAQDMDVNELLMGFRRLFRAQGGEIVCDAGAERLSRSDGVWSVETVSGTYAAPVVVNAAGAWVDDIALKAGLAPLGFKPCRRSVAIVPTPDDLDITTWPTTAEMDEQFYFKPEAGKLLISPADETLVDPHDAYADDMAIAEGIHVFGQVVDLEVNRIEHTWGGLRTFSPDRSHVIGLDPRTEGFFWCGGQGGYGIQSAHGAAMLTAGLVLENKIPEPLTALGLSRDEVAPDRFLS
ncbi:MAG: NAD(P)/FAD-dependent oxidoreductase [Hyphomicrobiales bacterium]